MWKCAELETCSRCIGQTAGFVASSDFRLSADARLDGTLENHSKPQIKQCRFAMFFVLDKLVVDYYWPAYT